MKNALKIWLVLTITTILNAQSLEGIKLCIDPGHGGNDPANDRFVVETGFWESQGNLDKAFHLKEILEDLGAEVILTRFGNDNSDEISLSQRAAIANQNNVDFFHSIHSNAYNRQSNYTVMLYNGDTGNPTFPEAVVMGNIMSEEIYSHHRTTDNFNRADRSFLGFNLGVLRPLAMPGVLSEGSFHDYIPESFRLRNSAYKRHEAWAMAKSFLRYFNGGTYQVGEIAGVVRDQLQSVDYYHIPTTADGKKPVNNVTVRLEPGGKIYVGDEHNNGFFLFDSLQPGEYTLYIEAENFGPDTLTATVEAGETTFADAYLTIQPDLNPPKVVNALPFDGYNGVSLLSEMQIEFDIWMNSESVEDAFAISPNVSGAFSWENDNKILTFTPDVPLTKGTAYTITVTGDAESYFGVNIENEYSYEFTTRSKLNLVDAYPAFGNTDISRTVEVRLSFDAAIDAGTLFNNIRFMDADNNDVAPIVDQQAYAKGQIVFTPAEELEPNSTYYIRLGGELGDVEELALGVDILLMFTTEDEVDEPGWLQDDFESDNHWLNPLSNDSTSGVKADPTSFVLTTSKKIEGSKSGKLNYVFVDDTAQVAVGTGNSGIGAGDDSGTYTLGIWVYGDLSYNILEYWFHTTETNLAKVEIDTIDWTGWKFKQMPSTHEENLVVLTDIAVIRSETGSSGGTLYFDKAVSDFTLAVEPVDGGVPASYTLEQNYPNPFNPSTTIRFSLPEAGNVNLVIYNLLGERIATLINSEYHNAGTWQTSWNGRNANGISVPSGIYFYRIMAGSFVQTRKMILLK